MVKAKLLFSRREVRLDSDSCTTVRRRQTYNSDRRNGDFVVRREHSPRTLFSALLNLRDAWAWQLLFDSPVT